MAILDQCLDSKHTRLPVYLDNKENIIGVLHAKDLVRNDLQDYGRFKTAGKALKDFDITEVSKQPYFVPNTTALDDQMREFLRLHSHFALVVDEYGSLQGLITLEDILEEIVGEITDEFDGQEEAGIERASDGQMIVEGGMTIRDFNRPPSVTYQMMKQTRLRSCYS